MTGQKLRQAILLCKVSGRAVGSAIAGYAFGHFIDWAATSFYIDKRWATVMVVLLIGGPLAFFGVSFEQTFLDSGSDREDRRVILDWDRPKAAAV